MQNQISPATKEKKIFCFPRKRSMVPLNKEPFRKTIQIDLDTFGYNQIYPGIIQTYSKPLCNLGIIRAAVYPEPWHIQNQKHIQNPGMLRTPVYPELWHIQNPRVIHISTMKHFVKIVNGKQFRSISLLRSLSTS